MIKVTADRMGRTIVVVEDHQAQLLNKLSRTGWVEIEDANYGHSATVPVGTEGSHLIESILGAVVVDAKNSEDVRIAQSGSFYGFVVGQGGWDDEKSCWRDYPNTRHLHAEGSIVKAHGGWRFAG